MILINIKHLFSDSKAVTYCNSTLIITFNITHLFAHSQMFPSIFMLHGAFNKFPDFFSYGHLNLT